MNIKETAEFLNQEYKKANPQTLEEKLETLEQIIVNLCERVDYLERSK